MSVVNCFASSPIDVLRLYSASEALLRWCSHDVVPTMRSFVASPPTPRGGPETRQLWGQAKANLDRVCCVGLVV